MSSSHKALRTRVQSTIALLAFAIAGALSTACSDDAQQPTPTVPKTPATDGGDAAAPSAKGKTSIEQYCAAVAAQDARCDQTDACNQAEHERCPQASALFSDAMRSATAACAATESCERSDQCFDAKFDKEPRTPVQKKLAQNYCTSCVRDIDVEQCETLTLSGSSPTMLVAMLNDTIVTEIDAECTPTGASGSGDRDARTCSGFLECIGRVASRHALPSLAACGE